MTKTEKVCCMCSEKIEKSERHFECSQDHFGSSKFVCEGCLIDSDDEICPYCCPHSLTEVED